MNIETINKFCVASTGTVLFIQNAPRGAITFDDALLLAAYLVAMADGQATHSFSDVLEAVTST